MPKSINAIRVPVSFAPSIVSVHEIEHLRNDPVFVRDAVPLLRLKASDGQPAVRKSYVLANAVRDHVASALRRACKDFVPRVTAKSVTD